MWAQRQRSAAGTSLARRNKAKPRFKVRTSRSASRGSSRSSRRSQSRQSSRASNGTKAPAKKKKPARRARRGPATKPPAPNARLPAPRAPPRESALARAQMLLRTPSKHPQRTRMDVYRTTNRVALPTGITDLSPSFLFVPSFTTGHLFLVSAEPFPSSYTATWSNLTPGWSSGALTTRAGWVGSQGLWYNEKIATYDSLGLAKLGEAPWHTSFQTAALPVSSSAALVQPVCYTVPEPSSLMSSLGRVLGGVVLLEFNVPPSTTLTLIVQTISALDLPTPIATSRLEAKSEYLGGRTKRYKMAGGIHRFHFLAPMEDTSNHDFGAPWSKMIPSPGSSFMDKDTFQICGTPFQYLHFMVTDILTPSQGYERPVSLEISTQVGIQCVLPKSAHHLTNVPANAGLTSEQRSTVHQDMNYALSATSNTAYRVLTS